MQTRRRFLAGLAGTAAVAALGGCAVNPATGRQSFTGFGSIQDDVREGAAQHPKLVDAFGGRYEDRRIAAYVSDLGGRLARQTEMPDLPYSFTVLNSPIVNAFALPGGYVHVSRGLLALAADEAELAGVLAHELGHVTARHGAERRAQAMLAQIGLVVLGAAVNVPGVNQVAGLAASAFVQGYSRQQEFEADSLGVRYMSRAGYDPRAMVDFLATLRAHSGLDARMKGLPEGTVDEFNIMSTHPRTIERVEAALREARALRPPAPVRRRDAYLAAVDGLIYGDDPDQGVILGQRFVHPGLRLEFTVPEAFRIVNGQKQVLARRADGALIVFDMAEARFGAEAHLTREWAAQARLFDLERISVNGMPGATAWTRVADKGADVRFVVLQGPGTSVWRFLFVMPHGASGGLAEDLRRTTYSVRRLSAGEAARIKPLRLLVVKARPDDSLAALARPLPFGPFNEESFRILNDLEDGRPLPSGQAIKVVAG